MCTMAIDAYRTMYNVRCMQRMRLSTIHLLENVYSSMICYVSDAVVYIYKCISVMTSSKLLPYHSMTISIFIHVAKVCCAT